MKKIAIMAVLAITLIAGCELEPAFDEGYKSTLQALPDSRFVGEFQHYNSGGYYVTGGNFYSYDRKYITWYFDGTTKAVRAHTNLTKAQFTYLYPNAVGSHTYEIKLEGGHLYSRLWDNRYSDWIDDGEYSFDQQGNLLLTTNIRTNKYERMNYVP